MSPFRFLRGHPRDDLASYAAGELSPGRVALVEAHLGSCPACRTEVEELRVIRAALRSLPEVEAPRSFALTPQMAAEPGLGRAPRPTPQLTLALRLATAGLATALAAVLVIDIGTTGDGGGGGNGDQAALRVAAPEEAGFAVQGTDAAAAGSPAAVDDDSAAQDDDRAATGTLVAATPQPEPAAGGLGAGSGGTTSGGGSGEGAEPFDTASPREAPAETAVPAPDAGPAGASPDGAPDLEVTPVAGLVDGQKDGDAEAADDSELGAPAGEGGGSVDTLLVVELALLAGLVAAVGGLVFAAGRRAR